MIVMGNFAPLFRAGLRKDFRDQFMDWEPEYSQFLKVGTTSDPEVRAMNMTGLNRLYERGDGEPIVYTDPKLGDIAVGVVKEFAGGFMITRRTVENDKYGKANQGAKWLARSARLTYEYRAAALLDDAFTGNFFRSWDNLPLIHTAHTLIGNTSVTVANRPAADVDLSVTGITALMDLWTVMKDDNGDPVKMWPNTLVIGTAPGDLDTALAIWNSTLQPFTADNTDNVIRRRLAGMGGNIVVSHFKANPKSYFMIDSKMNDAHFDIQRPVEFDDTFDFDTDVAKYKASTVFMIYVFDWRGWSGANPT